MIIIGYQGIGKSTLSNENLKYVDLESGNFWVNGERSDNWYEPYCNIAEHLSQQGYTVFVSSHEVVRKRLKNSKERVLCCVPVTGLEDYWVNKLKDRFELTGLIKDQAAYMNAKECYKENVLDLMTCGFEVFLIHDANYNLKEMIEEIEEQANMVEIRLKTIAGKGRTFPSKNKSK